MMNEEIGTFRVGLETAKVVTPQLPMAKGFIFGDSDAHAQ